MIQEFFSFWGKPCFDPTNIRFPYYLLLLNSIGAGMLLPGSSRRYFVGVICHGGALSRFILGSSSSHAFCRFSFFFIYLLSTYRDGATALSLSSLAPRYEPRAFFFCGNNLALSNRQDVSFLFGLSAPGPRLTFCRLFRM